MELKKKFITKCTIRLAISRKPDGETKYSSDAIYNRHGGTKNLPLCMKYYEFEKHKIYMIKLGRVHRVKLRWKELDDNLTSVSHDNNTHSKRQ